MTASFTPDEAQEIERVVLERVAAKKTRLVNYEYDGQVVDALLRGTHPTTEICAVLEVQDFACDRVGWSVSVFDRDVEQYGPYDGVHEYADAFASSVESQLWENIGDMEEADLGPPDHQGVRWIHAPAEPPDTSTDPAS